MEYPAAIIRVEATWCCIPEHVHCQENLAMMNVSLQGQYTYMPYPEHSYSTWKITVASYSSPFAAKSHLQSMHSVILRKSTSTLVTTNSMHRN